MLIEMERYCIRRGRDFDRVVREYYDRLAGVDPEYFVSVKRDLHEKGQRFEDWSGNFISGLDTPDGRSRTEWVNDFLARRDKHKRDYEYFCEW